MELIPKKGLLMLMLSCIVMILAGLFIDRLFYFSMLLVSTSAALVGMLVLKNIADKIFDFKNREQLTKIIIALIIVLVSVGIWWVVLFLCLVGVGGWLFGGTMN